MNIRVLAQVTPTTYTAYSRREVKHITLKGTYSNWDTNGPRGSGFAKLNTWVNYDM